MTAEIGEAYEPAARVALAGFGIEAAALRFVHLSENVTFRVTDARDGSRLVLRLHRPGYHDIAALRSEHLWTRALVQAGIAAPEPLLTPGGESFVEVPVGGSETRWAGLARWVEGELLSEILDRDPASRAEHLRQLGAIMAAMHNQASAWTPPPGFRRHRMDADGLMGPAPFWGPFWDQRLLTAAERAMLLDLRDRLHAALRRLGEAPERFSLIHADLHPHNVLIDGGRAAVIDFDDAGFGWHLYDLAAALIGYQDRPDFAAIQLACIEGYRSVRALPDAELALLPMFLLMRGMAYLGWCHQRPELATAATLQSRKARVCAVAPGFVILV
ncbi:phosphotransferase [Roseomonas sp. HJA6]|uniref:Phosphotransferase n=1 Tax=Roseomonas alba TaxID=2846776 RepID=A0ABS7A5H9_9PROT|nr:phosphotransferase [Neoroseomonas alba]MBW6397572.1 phosphotransferase [Neoroseomonas alba]